MVTLSIMVDNLYWLRFDVLWNIQTFVFAKFEQAKLLWHKCSKEMKKRVSNTSPRLVWPIIMWNMFFYFLTLNSRHLVRKEMQAITLSTMSCNTYSSSSRAKLKNGQHHHEKLKFDVGLTFRFFFRRIPEFCALFDITFACRPIELIYFFSI